jgi:aspartate aminotransferase
MAPTDPILGITEAFNASKDPNKMNLGVGAYRDDKGKPVVLDVVREAEAKIAGERYMEYLPIAGYKPFINSAVQLALGDDNAAITEGRVAAIQSLSGTGACRIMAEFMHRFMPGSKILISDPTWANHHNIFRDAGVERELYRYYKAETCGLDFEGMIADLEGAPAGTVVLLHACAHNPTGVDPTAEQWEQISDVIKQKKLFPFFDSAYQGFATGDCERDARAPRMFLEQGHAIGLSQSFAKNMGLYGQRIGTFSLTTADPAEAKTVESQMKLIARAMYSNPPQAGAHLVAEILGDSTLKQRWYKEVGGMATRIIDMRKLLRENIEKSGSSRSWQHITDQIGMFAYTGLTGEQVDTLAEKSHIFMTRNGRISMAGVNSGNVERLAAAIAEVTK